jgi:hypothetical protein
VSGFSRTRGVGHDTAAVSAGVEAASSGLSPSRCSCSIEVAGLVTLIGVLPTAVFLEAAAADSQSDAVVGVGFGNLPCVLGVAAGSTYGREPILRGVAFSSLLGLTGAALFWFITLRPEKLRLDR